MGMIVNESEAKTNLSKRMEMAYHGEEVIIAPVQSSGLYRISDDKNFLNYDFKIIFYKRAVRFDKPGFVQHVHR